jgi:DNA-binding response OmpR family regulator
MALGAAEYMTKPYSPTDLMLRIRGLLDPCTAGEET